MPAIAKVSMLFCGMFVLASIMTGQEKDRTKIPDKYKWNLTDIYPNDDAWKKAKDGFAARLPAIAAYPGTLKNSAKQLLACLDLVTEISKDNNRLQTYAGLISDQDKRESKYQAMTQEMTQLGSDFAAKAAFIEPEILKIDKATIESFMKEEKGLGIYRHYLDDILRRQQHTGTEGEEKIIADAGLMADGAQNIYGIFANADFPYPDVTLADGTTRKLDQAAFGVSRTLTNRATGRKSLRRSSTGSTITAERWVPSSRQTSVTTSSI